MILKADAGQRCCAIPMALIGITLTMLATGTVFSIQAIIERDVPVLSRECSALLARAGDTE